MLLESGHGHSVDPCVIAAEHFPRNLQYLVIPTLKQSALLMFFVASAPKCFHRGLDLGPKAAEALGPCGNV